MRVFKRLSEKLDYLSQVDRARVKEAYLLAAKAHASQKRSTGEPYVTHPVAVAGIIADMHLDADAIMAALLHDVIEDTDVEKATIAAQFGHAVAEMVDGVSKLTKIDFTTKREAQAENFRKMVLAMSHDIRVIIIKLADRMHNIRTLGSLRRAKQCRIARETLEIYAPIGRRLGMHDFSIELEELSFQARYPMRYQALRRAIHRARGTRKKVLNLIDKSLSEAVCKGIKHATVIGREKHIYSIYRKMVQKRIPFNEIMDVYAFRIVVDTVEDCYRALGLVHSLFKPVPERFKDYIAIPKANGYQSLHTTLFGPYGLPLEVQIRTRQFDQMATSGIAAHWLYKLGDSHAERSHVRAERWVRDLLDLQHKAGDSVEFFENVKLNLFPDEVYVFTPKGRILTMPAGSTAVDFAYAVHTDIGNHCISAKIDRQIAPLSTPLVNGQTIEVMVASQARPNPAWLDYVVTSKARSGIRHYLKNQRRVESIHLGKQLLKKALMQHQVVWRKVGASVRQALLKEVSVASMDDFLVDIGLGHRTAMLEAQRVACLLDKMKDEGSSEVGVSEEDDHDPLLIKGTEGMVVRFAECCFPIPGDPIIGVLRVGKGVVVHAAGCKRLTKLQRNPDHCVALRWAKQAKSSFRVGLQMGVQNERGALGVLASTIAGVDADIDLVEVLHSDAVHSKVKFIILVRDRKHLAMVMRALRQLALVQSISRL